MSFSNWLNRINEIERWQRTTLVSRKEFTKCIRELVAVDSPISDVRFQVKSSDVSYIDISATEQTEYSEMQQFPFGKRTLVCQFNRRDPLSAYDPSVGDALPRHLMMFYKSYWKFSIRDEKTGLPNMDQTGAKSWADAFINRSLGEGSIVGCAFLDGDEFGEINKTLGHDIGDKVISMIGSVCVSISSKYDCISLHDGGDEFTVLSAIEHKQEFVENILEIYRQLRRDGASIIDDRQLTCSAGIFFQEADDREHHYSDIRKAAESALMADVKGVREKQRRTISIVRSGDLPIADRDHCLLATRCSLADQHAFSNVWMNSISTEIRKALQSNVDCSSCLASLINDIGLQPCKVLRANCLPSHDFCSQKNVNLFDIAMSVFHGIASNVLGSGERHEGKKVELVVDQEAAHVLYGDSSVTLPRNFACGVVERVTLGVIPRLVRPTNIEEIAKCLRIAVLIHIGEAPQDVLALPFYECVFVDDRPTKGGQLPDFWEHSISQLLYILEQNPNIHLILCWGPEDLARKTVELLRTIGEGTMDTVALAASIGRSESEVSELCGRVVGKIVFATSRRSLIDKYLDATENLVDLLPLSTQRKLSNPMLVRELSEDRYSLFINEGFRANSIGEAFPLALDILRDSEKVGVVNDRYGKKFHELMDFKIVIENPVELESVEYENIPRQDLENYYSRAFGESGTSLFGQEIEAQSNPFIGELKKGITSNPAYNSRRAIMIVPNRIKGSDLDPLGLISIRGSVAPHNKVHVLRFSYYWRTVEALVGLPHSLYASVTHAFALSRKLRDVTGMDVPVARVVYVASSLHISSEQNVLELAKRIVDAASR